MGLINQLRFGLSAFVATTAIHFSGFCQGVIETDYSKFLAPDSVCDTLFNSRNNIDSRILFEAEQDRLESDSLRTYYLKNLFVKLEDFAGRIIVRMGNRMSESVAYNQAYYYWNLARQMNHLGNSDLVNPNSQIFQQLNTNYSHIIQKDYTGKFSSLAHYQLGKLYFGLILNNHQKHIQIQDWMFEGVLRHFGKITPYFNRLGLGGNRGEININLYSALRDHHGSDGIGKSLEAGLSLLVLNYSFNNVFHFTPKSEKEMIEEIFFDYEHVPESLRNKFEPLILKLKKRLDVLNLLIE